MLTVHMVHIIIMHACAQCMEYNCMGMHVSMLQPSICVHAGSGTSCYDVVLYLNSELFYI